MRYSVVTEEGDRFGGNEEADRIRDFLSERKEHPMIRMANQSIFADMLEASSSGFCSFTLHASRKLVSWLYAPSDVC